MRDVIVELRVGFVKKRQCCAISINSFIYLFVGNWRWFRKKYNYELESWAYVGNAKELKAIVKQILFITRYNEMSLLCKNEWLYYSFVVECRISQQEKEIINSL